MGAKQKIQNLKNFASLDKSFKEWLTTCPREYIWQIDDVTTVSYTHLTLPTNREV